MVMRLRYVLLVAFFLFALPTMAAYVVGYIKGADAEHRYIVRLFSQELQDAVATRNMFWFSDVKNVRFQARKLDKRRDIAVVGAEDDDSVVEFTPVEPGAVQIAGAGADTVVRPR